MLAKSKVGVVYLPFYHNDDFSRRALTSLAAQTYPHAELTLIIVNNPHPELGSYLPRLQELIRETPDLPTVITLGAERNLGFAGGNNLGIERALAEGCDYVMILNDDAFLAPDCLEHLVNALEADRTIGEAQPIIALYPETDRVNTAGNALHVLGFGYSMGYKQPVTDWRSEGVRDVGYVSGAIALFRADLLRRFGYLEEGFFMYHEDTEYSLRLGLRGYRTVCVDRALGYHNYQFLRNKKALEWMERNRYTNLLLTYKAPTLLLLAPALLGTELALWAFALRGGWLKEKWRATQPWFQLKTWQYWRPRRTKNLQERTITDHQVLQRLTGKIDFQETDQQHWLVQKVANPLLSTYLRILQLGVWW